jgi:hypothetical protein
VPSPVTGTGGVNGTTRAKGTAAKARSRVVTRHAGRAPAGPTAGRAPGRADGHARERRWWQRVNRGRDRFPTGGCPPGGQRGGRARGRGKNRRTRARRPDSGYAPTTSGTRKGRDCFASRPSSRNSLRVRASRSGSACARGSSTANGPERPAGSRWSAASAAKMSRDRPWPISSPKPTSAWVALAPGGRAE